MPKRKEPEYFTCNRDGCYRPTRTKYCSQECAKTDQRIADRPTAEDLEALVWAHPSKKLAEMFGVTDVTIANWCRACGVEKPPRGYWTGRTRRQVGRDAH